MSHTSTADRCVIDIRAWDNSPVAPDAKGEARKGRRGRERVSALRRVVSCAGDFAVVCSDDGLRQVQQRGPGVGYRVDAGGNESAAADSVAVGGELPEPIGGVHGNVGDGTAVLGGIDVAEGVAAWLALLQVRGEKGRRERGLGVAEKGLLLCWLDWT